MAATPFDELHVFPFCRAAWNAALEEAAKIVAEVWDRFEDDENFDPIETTQAEIRARMKPEPEESAAA